MDKQTKLSFDRWMQREYPELFRELTDTDSLHDAYIIVNRLSRIMPDEYLTQMKRAYLISRRREAQYLFRFVVPAPRFWLFQDDETEDMFNTLNIEQIQKQQDIKDKQDAQRLSAFSQWVRSHYPEDKYIIFRMYYYEKLPVTDIARILHITKKQVCDTIQDMCDNYRDNKRKQPIEGQKQEQPSTAKHCSICFRLSKNGSGQIIPSVLCIKRCNLQIGTRLYFSWRTMKILFMFVNNSMPVWSCVLHSGTRPYNLVGQNKRVVTDVLNRFNAQHSVTLAVTNVNKNNKFKLDLNNPIKID